MALSRRPVASWLLVSISSLVACNATVDPIGGGPSSTGGEGSAIATSSGVNVGGGGGSGGSGSGGGSGGFGTGAGNPTAAGGAGPTSIAMYESELYGTGGGTTVAAGTGVGGSDTGAGGFGTAVGSSAVGAGGAGGTDTTVSTGSGGGGSVEGERLYLVLDDAQLSCASSPLTNVPDCSAGPRALIGLPAIYQETLGTYQLSDPAIASAYLCGDQGGSFTEGTIQISAFGSDQIVATLANTFPPGLDGTHTITRCTRFIPYGNRAIAYFRRPEEGGAGGGSSVVGTTSGGSEDPFTIDLSNHVISCADPSGAPPAPGETVSHYVITIPASYLTPDVYPLSDAAISVYLSEESSDAGSIASTGGSGSPGTLTILEVTDSYIDVKVEGTGFDFADGEGQIPRCGG